MVKKQYLCSGFKNRHNLFCTLKINRLIPWKNSRRETAIFMVLRSVSEAIPNRSRQKDGFFLYMVLWSVAKQYHIRDVKITAFLLNICVFEKKVVLLQAICAHACANINRIEYK